MMKKTTVALALAATMVTGSAMAWTAGGSGGNLEFSGTLTPSYSGNPWEVMIGSAVIDLDASINPGEKKVTIPVAKSITALGIRTANKTTFEGQPGIAPQIDYAGKLGTTWNQGYTPMKLDVNDNKGVKIGTLSAPVLAGGLFSSGEAGGFSQSAIFADQPGTAFFGGLGTSASDVLKEPDQVTALVKYLNPDILANYDSQNGTEEAASSTTFITNTKSFSGFYGAGIPEGSTMTLELDTAASNSSVDWKASLPITVSYQ
ncbi:fimbrial protein [Salmonella enterica]|nr:fimbrial protein [Salmonella enterica]EFR5852152.1 fimbrial protein [Salmonella enterica]EGW7007668.1 fimbrial protein [Salmonella enterica]EJQ8924513.1 fimbrial protein [Salmonella enterica]EJQ9754956.1 fimbrial protein [Salmonella enterica]